MTTQGYTLLDAPKPRQKLIHIHSSADEIGRVYTPDLAIAAAREGSHVDDEAGLRLALGQGMSHKLILVPVPAE